VGRTFSRVWWKDHEVTAPLEIRKTGWIPCSPRDQEDGVDSRLPEPSSTSGAYDSRLETLQVPAATRVQDKEALGPGGL
jgi:hypothetical protein